MRLQHRAPTWGVIYCWLRGCLLISVINLQMQSDTGRDASLPSGRIQPVQQTRNAQQAQSVRHPVNQAPAVRTGHPASVSATVLTAQQAHQIQQTQQVQGAQQAQHAMQQEKAAAQELLAFSRQGPKEAASKAGLYMQTGQTTCQETVGLSPRFRAGSCQPGATPDIPTGLDPRLMTGQFGRSGSGQLKHANSGQAGQDNLMRAASDQLMQNIRAMSGQLSGQAEAAMPAQRNLGQAGSCNVAFMDPQASRLQMQENVEAQLRQGARSHPPHQAVHPAGPNVNIAVQQQQQQNGGTQSPICCVNVWLNVHILVSSFCLALLLGSVRGCGGLVAHK